MTDPTTLGDRHVLEVSLTTDVDAPIETTFAAVLRQLGPDNRTPDGTPMPMRLEAFPGGRWFRDLGDDRGHCWALVQSIKAPTLLEFSGPLFMSYAVCNNVIYRLSEHGSGTRIAFRHTGIGLFPPEHIEGVKQGWSAILEHVVACARA